jgi:hypothetical protein
MERLMYPAFAGQIEIDHNTPGKGKCNHHAGYAQAEPYCDAVPAIHATSISPRTTGPKGSDVTLALQPCCMIS